MSNSLIRIALETALNNMTPALATAFENNSYTPVAGTPYQEAHVLFAEPDNPTMGNTFKREQGIFQVTLRYPLNTGTAAINARAELIRTTFPRATSFTSGGVTVTVERTPHVAPGYRDGDRWAVPVKIRFFANI